MFRRINADSTQNIKERAEELFRLHPSEIAALMEIAWDFRQTGGAPGSPKNRSQFYPMPENILKLFGLTYDNNLRNIKAGTVLWDHLIYAYLIENTRALEVFRKVISEYLHGEKLGTPSNADAQAWLRNTEALFFSAPGAFSICNIQSRLRPDPDAYRRNNYYRMFGMDLNHGRDDGQPYPYIRAEAANREFVETFEQFLYEVWVGISNFGNTSGVNRTDNAAIANLARQLNFMLLTRRQNGNLSQSEFCFVAMMAWFHLTLEFDSPIVNSLRAEGSSEDQRLYKIAEKVGVKAHGKAYDFFRLADPMSRLLIQVEEGVYNDPAAVPALYDAASPVQADMRTIITHWSIATGRDMKVQRGKNLTTAAAPAPAAPASNGVPQESYL